MMEVAVQRWRFLQHIYNSTLFWWQVNNISAEHILTALLVELRLDWTVRLQLSSHRSPLIVQKKTM